MAEIKTYMITDGVNIHSFINENFKTMRISVNMVVPLSHETAAKYGILPSLVTRATSEYPDYTAFGQRLAELYGAYVDSSVSKIGSYQILTLSVGGIADRYAFDDENMQSELLGILLSILFNPLKKNGLFPSEGFEQEKRQILEIFDAEFNDKINYARTRANEIIFDSEAEGIGRYGEKADVEKLTLEAVSSAWDELLSSAKFEIFILGNCTQDISLFESAFSKLGKEYSYKPKASSADTKEITETMKLSQSKLVMGYRMPPQAADRITMHLMSAILGGTPSSKLFLNVREAKHLCYYCSSRIDTLTNSMTIESGVETENLEDARKEISKQIEAMQRGDITDAEIEAAKLAMINSYNGVKDSLHSTELWCLSQMFYDEIDLPEERAEKLKTVTKQSIIDTANFLNLDTVYILKGNSQ